MQSLQHQWCLSHWAGRAWVMSCRDPWHLWVYSILALYHGNGETRRLVLLPQSCRIFVIDPYLTRLWRKSKIMLFFPIRKSGPSQEHVSCHLLAFEVSLAGGKWLWVCDMVTRKIYRCILFYISSITSQMAHVSASISRPLMLGLAISLAFLDLASCAIIGKGSDPIRSSQLLFLSRWWFHLDLERWCCVLSAPSRKWCRIVVKDKQ
jgi:hypothetical protein